MRSFLFGIFIVFIPLSLTAQSLSEDDLVNKIDTAIAEERFEQAVNLINQGKELYPDSAVFYRIAGQMYYEKKLYRLALIEYQGAENLVPNDSDSLYQIGRLHGLLNENVDAVSYFERLLDDPYYSVAIIDDLAWMYFKTHRFEKGEQLLLDTIEKYGFSRAYAHTLGSIYSGMNRYDDSKDYYLQSIEAALSSGDSYFASVAYYNLSLLEFSFYQYDNALDYTRKSLDQRERASGYLSLAELFLMQRDFERTRDAYLDAEALDSTPLSLFGQSEASLDFGALESARIYRDEANKETDKSWMYNFGTDLDETAMEESLFKKELFRALANREKTILSSSPLEAVVKGWRIIKYRFLSYFYTVNYRVFTRKMAENQEEEGNDLDAWWLYAQSANDYPEIMLPYLHKAAGREIAMTELARPWYDLEEGLALNNTEKLETALAGFQQEWEKEPMERAHRSLAEIYRKSGNRSDYYSHLSIVYALNPGGLRQYGYGLPLRLDILSDADIPLKRFSGRIKRLLRKSGTPAFSESTEGVIYTLQISLQDGTSQFALYDDRGVPLFSGEYPMSNYRKKSFKQLINHINNELYAPRVQGAAVY